MAGLKQQISGWGRYPVAECTLFRPERYAGLKPQAGDCIARGAGRGYGDAALNSTGAVILTERLNRFLELDSERGLLRAEAGATVGEILDALLPRGWFLPVVPGTRHVTLGGCVAADVHGKNQHRAGNFGDHVHGLTLILADGSQTDCSPEKDPELFWATVGGMGLTGIIGEVTVALQPVETAWVQAEYKAARDLGGVMDLLVDEQWDDTYTVAWVDALTTGDNAGRGIVSRAHHAPAAELPAGRAPFKTRPRRAKEIPFTAPGWLLNPKLMAAYNGRYYRKHAALTQPRLETAAQYFFPLDGIDHWNRLYGKKGFVQYQCVLSGDRAREGVRTLCDQLRPLGLHSYLAVLKRFGAESPAPLSFPKPGYTLALDIPRRGRGELEALAKLDEIVLEHEGRVYLAKDARLSAEQFRAMYPRYSQWRAVKDRVDPDNVFNSDLARRLGIVEAGG